MNLKELIGNQNREEELILKKEIIKTVIVVNLLMKNKGKVRWINILNNFQLSDNKTCDLYYENIKEKTVQVFKIVKRKTNKRLNEIKKELEQIDLSFYKEVIVLDMDNFSEDISEINERIKRYI